MILYVEDGDAAIFDDLVFRRDKKSGYYLNAKTHKRLHVYVWEYYNGEIPKGCQVHHIDQDKTNNEIENLQLLTAEEHMHLHSTSWDEERYQKQVAILKEKAIPKAAEWHKSTEGMEWHREHYEQMKDKWHVKEKYICQECGKEFITTNNGRVKFCSNGCRTKNRRKSGVDNVTRKCEWCGSEFTVNKYSRTKTCGRDCGRKLRWNKRNQESRESERV